MAAGRMAAQRERVAGTIPTIEASGPTLSGCIRMASERYARFTSACDAELLTPSSSCRDLREPARVLRARNEERRAIMACRIRPNPRAQGKGQTDH
jgi:hypothetical protein